MTIFVTALLHIYSNPYDHRTIQWRIEKFKEILDTGITVKIFVSPDIVGLINELCQQYKNLSIFRVLSIQETEIWSFWSHRSTLLPNCRREDKDTIEYLCLMNAKIEFVEQVITNEHNTYAWIDCNISHIFSKGDYIDTCLSFLGKCRSIKPGIYTPGCWQKSDIPIDVHTVCWRFCGGFFIGDTTSIRTMKANWINVCNDPLITPTWEVNIWAIMEQRGLLSVNWYAGDHNNSIITGLPTWAYSLQIGRVYEPWNRVEYPYIENYRCSAISCVTTNIGKRYINARFVNYYILENGTYYYPDGTGKIRNINCVAELEENELVVKNGFTQVREEELQLISREDAFSQGLEDIRIYLSNEKIKYIASTVGYGSTERIRMIVGDYNAYLGKLVNGTIIETDCDEKNWIPLPDDTYIYSWCPYKIISLNQNKVNIVKTVAKQVYPFMGIRGSTIFIPYKEKMIGIVHFSEQIDTKKRHYYHMFILLDRDYNISRWSQPFHFYSEMGIEFCIGITMYNNGLYCWVSHYDRDPTLFRVEQNEIENLWI